MTQKERLIELLQNIPMANVVFGGKSVGRKVVIASHIADYLLENGVIVPPCKVGDTIWFENRGEIKSAVIYHCEWKLTSRGLVLTDVYAKTEGGLGVYFNGSRIGQNVFLTQEEAEKALAERVEK